MFEKINYKHNVNINKSTNDSGVESIDDKKYYQYKDKVMRVIKEIEETGLPKKNEQLRIITLRSFNTAAFIEYIANKENIKEAILVIYSINHEAAKLINELSKSKKIKKMTILMSNLRNKAHRQKEQITRDMFVNNPNIDLFFCSSHAKIVALKTDKNNYIIEGSGNMSFNSRIEQYIIDNDRNLFDFTKKWVLEIKEYLKDKNELILT